MSANTSIEWTDKSWNPVTGCDKVSAGCRNCYAERIANRFKGSKAFPNGFDVTLHHDRLADPLKWKKPTRIFVNSMSDLFHEDIPFKFIHEVWGTMRQTPQHTYQILTKRPERMLEVVSQIRAMEALGYAKGFYSHVHLGVSVENQASADERIGILQQVPASVRFLSCEPLIGPITFRWAKWLKIPSRPDGSSNHLDGLSGIHWVISGGESGLGARPMDPDWPRKMRDECQEAGVAFFMKQMARKATIPPDLFIRQFPESKVTA